MKGQGLPINTMIIIAISVMALLAIVLLFVRSWGSGSVSVAAQAAWNEVCGEWRKSGCGEDEFTDEDISVMFNGEDRTVKYMCNEYSSNSDLNQCRVSCCGAFTPTYDKSV